MPMGYDESYARHLLDRLGEQGRRYYLTRQIPLDAIYPALLAIWLIALWRYLADKVGLTAGWVRQVWLVPIQVAGVRLRREYHRCGRDPELSRSRPEPRPDCQRIDERQVSPEHCVLHSASRARWTARVSPPSLGVLEQDEFRSTLSLVPAQAGTQFFLPGGPLDSRFRGNERVDGHAIQPNGIPFQAPGWRRLELRLHI
jgi:hypothetical protein